MRAVPSAAWGVYPAALPCGPPAAAAAAAAAQLLHGQRCSMPPTRPRPSSLCCVDAHRRALPRACWPPPRLQLLAAAEQGRTQPVRRGLAGQQAGDQGDCGIHGRAHAGVIQGRGPGAVGLSVPARRSSVAFLQHSCSMLAATWAAGRGREATPRPPLLRARRVPSGCKRGNIATLRVPFFSLCSAAAGDQSN